MPTKEQELDAFSAAVRLFQDQEIPDVTDWNVDPGILLAALARIGDFFTDVESVAAGINTRVTTLENKAAPQWVLDAAAPSMGSAASFLLPGDRRTDYKSAQRARLTIGASKIIVVIQGTTYDGVNTTINVSPAVITSGLTAVEYGVVRESMPQIQLTDLFFDIATQAELDAAVASLTAAIATKVAKAGDTMTGLLLLSADPVAALGAATKQYVDTRAPKNSQYLALAADAALENERVFTPRDALAGSDAGSGGAYSLDFNPLDTTLVALRDDFVSGHTTAIGSLNWREHAEGGGSTLTGQPANFPRIGILRLTTGGTNGDTKAIALQTPTHEAPLGALGLLADWDCVFVFRLVTTTSVTFRIGLMPAPTGFSNNVPDDGMFLRYDTNAGDTAFRLECRQASVITISGTTYPVGTAWHKIRIRAIAAGQVGFTFDNQPEVVISTNIPTVDVTAVINVRTRTNATRSAEIDFFAYKMRGLAR